MASNWSHQADQSGAVRIDKLVGASTGMEEGKVKSHYMQQTSSGTVICSSLLGSMATTTTKQNANAASRWIIIDDDTLVAICMKTALPKKISPAEIQVLQMNQQRTHHQLGAGPFSSTESDNQLISKSRTSCLLSMIYIRQFSLYSSL